MGLHSLVNEVWTAGIVLQFILAVVLFYRKTWQQLPVFAAYAFFNLFEAAIAYSVYSVYGNKLAYFYVYWACEAVSTILGFAVVYEVFTTLFSTHQALRRLATTVFKTAVAILIVLGLVVIYAQPQADRTAFGSAVMVVAEATRIVEVGLLMFLFLFSTAFGLHWREHIFGIALGLGLFAAVDLVNVTLRSYFGNSATDILNFARVATFCLSILLWTIYLGAPERVAESQEIPERAQLEQWNQAVMELIHR
ncbi:MAG TPA: hypothetical protein VFR84_09740 [Candidatus Angelobacter sp.]|nr:hypothetical protein [Candidatus Angelobacter sp.]